MRTHKEMDMEVERIVGILEKLFSNSRNLDVHMFDLVQYLSFETRCEVIISALRKMRLDVARIRTRYDKYTVLPDSKKGGFHDFELIFRVRDPSSTGNFFLHYGHTIGLGKLRLEDRPQFHL